MDVLEALMGAAEGGDAEAVGALLASGAGANARTASGETALMRAAAKGHAGAVRVLLGGGADANLARDDGMTALVLAAFFGHAEAVRALVEEGADTSARDQRGLTALNWASSRGNVEVVRLLKELAPANDASHVRRRVIEGSLRPPHEDEAKPAPADEAAPNDVAANEAEAVFNDAGARPADTQGARSVERARRHQRVEFMRDRARERERQRARRPTPATTQPAAASQSAPTGQSSVNASHAAATGERAERADASARAPHTSRGRARRVSRLVVAAGAAVVLLASSGALFYRYARRQPAAPAQPVQVVQPPSQVEEVQPSPSPADAQNVIVEAPNTQYVDPNAAPGALTPFPSTATSAPTDLTVVPAPRATYTVPPSSQRSAGGAGDEPSVVGLAQPEAQPAAEPRRESARPERREERAAPTPANDAAAARREGTPAVQTRAAEDDTLPSSMIAPKPSATPRRKVIQWP